MFTKKYQKPDLGSWQRAKIDTFPGQIPSKFHSCCLPNFPSHLKISFKISTTGTKQGNVQH